MFTGIYGVCEGDAYVEAPVSALLLSIWRHCQGFLLLFIFFSTTHSYSLFSFLGCMFLIPCNFLLLFFLFFFSFVFVGDGYSLEHLTVRCCKERMLRYVDSNSNNMYILHCMSWIKRKPLHYNLDPYIGDSHCFIFLFTFLKKKAEALSPISRDVDNVTSLLSYRGKSGGWSLMMMNSDVGPIKSNLTCVV
ncbi:hypothetical protein V8C34DRAFT_244654 [Trichoderma compactum]